MSLSTSDNRDKEHIKSFVIRAARMSPAQRKAYDELRDIYCIPFADAPGDPARYFPRPERPLYVEIGFGMGDATAEIAAGNPDTNLLGIEVHKPGVGKLLGAIRRLELSNVRIIHDDALPVVEYMISPATVDAFLLFFPDPWPKTRHHKRRIVRASFVELLAERLRPGGFIYAATDWAEYAEWMLDVFASVRTLHNPHGGYAPRQPWRPETSFEKKALSAGREILEVQFFRS